jgi:polyisoprenyl-phosphate glycosyltransferase
MFRSEVVIVIPVFNDDASLRALLDRLAVCIRGQPATMSVLVVDDGSFPALDLGSAGPDLGLSGEILTLRRNVGHQRAIAIGIAYAVANKIGKTVLVMDGDGEDNPDDVHRLISACSALPSPGIVVAERAKRSEGQAFLAFYWLYRWLFVVLTGKKIRFGNFSAMPASAAERLANMSELWLSLPGAILRSRLPITNLRTERGRRYFGTSKMNFVALVVHGLSAMAVFVEQAFTRIVLFALSLSALVIGASIVAIIFKLIGWSTPGWMTTVVGISLVVLLNIATLGYVSLSLSIVGNLAAVASPSVSYATYVLGVSRFGATHPAKT